MNTIKKIAVALAVMMVAAAMAAPAVMGDEDFGYSATVRTGHDTTLNVVSTGFGDILVNDFGELTPSFDLNNTGDWNATIEAKFTTNVSGIWGLINSSNVIGGSNFSINATDLGGSYIALQDSDNYVEITPQLPGDSTTYDYDAKLAVPSVAAGAYTGTVRLAFSNA